MLILQWSFLCPLHHANGLIFCYQLKPQYLRKRSHFGKPSRNVDETCWSDFLCLNQQTGCRRRRRRRRRITIIIIIIYLLKAFSSVNRTGSPRGYSQVQILHKSHTTKNNLPFTKHAHYTNEKHINIIRKLVSSVLLMANKVRRRALVPLTVSIWRFNTRY